MGSNPSEGEDTMITEDQAINWLWDRYKEARTMADIERWFDLFAMNRMEQNKRRADPASLS